MHREQLVAYLATLCALVVVTIGGMVIGAFSPGVLGKAEVFGLGTITGGLIGVLKMPTQRAEPAGTRADPIATEEVK
jgi:hypothetical protein